MILASINWVRHYLHVAKDHKMDGPLDEAEKTEVTCQSSCGTIRPRLLTGS